MSGSVIITWCWSCGKKHYVDNVILPHCMFCNPHPAHLYYYWLGVDPEEELEKR